MKIESYKLLETHLHICIHEMFAYLSKKISSFIYLFIFMTFLCNIEFESGKYFPCKETVSS